MNPRATKVEYIGNHQLLLTFDNNEIKVFSLDAYLDYPVYEDLKNEAFCRIVKVVDGIVQWDDEIDLDPDTLYLESKSLEAFSEHT